MRPEILYRSFFLCCNFEVIRIGLHFRLLEFGVLFVLQADKYRKMVGVEIFKAPHFLEFHVG